MKKLEKEMNKLVNSMLEMGYTVKKETYLSGGGYSSDFEEFRTNKIENGYIAYFNEKCGGDIFTTQFTFIVTNNDKQLDKELEDADA